MDPMDYSVITAGIVITGLLTAIGAAALVKVGPVVAKWGANKIVGMFGR